MNYDKMFSIVEDLPFDTEEDIYLSKRERIYLFIKAFCFIKKILFLRSQNQYTSIVRG